jgi:hypothetical protein
MEDEHHAHPASLTTGESAPNSNVHMARAVWRRRIPMIIKIFVGMGEVLGIGTTNHHRPENRTLPAVTRKKEQKAESVNSHDSARE